MDNFSIHFLTIPTSSLYPSVKAVKRRKLLFFLYCELGKKPPHLCRQDKENSNNTEKNMKELQLNLVHAIDMHNKFNYEEAKL